MFCPNCGAGRTKEQRKCEICEEQFDLLQIEKLAHDPLMEEHLVGQEVSKSETLLEKVHLATLEEKGQYEAHLLEQAKRETAAAEERQRIDLLKKKKWVLVVLGLAFAIVLISLSYLLYLYNTPKYVYLKAESNSLNKLHKNFNEKFERELELQRVIDSNPSNLKGSIKANFMVEGELAFEEQFIYRMIQGIISNTEVKYDTNLDPKNNKLYSDIRILNNDESILKLKLLEEKNRLAVKSSILGDKYLYANKNEFGNLMRNIDKSYSGPERVGIVNNNSVSPWIQISGEELVLLSDYGKEFFNSINNDDITISKNQTFSFEDLNVNGDAIEIRLTEKRFKEIAIRILTKLENDSRLYEIADRRLAFLDSINNIKFDDKKINREVLVKDLKKLIKNTKAEVKSVSFSDDFTHTVYVNNDNQIIARELTLPFENNKLTYTFINEDNKRSLNFISNSEVEFRAINNNYVKNNGKYTDGEYSFTTIGEARESIKLTTVSREDKINDTTIKTNTNFSFDSSMITSGTLPTLQGNVVRTLNQDLDKNYSKENVVVNIGVDTSKEDNVDLFAISLSVNRDYLIKKSVNIPVLTSANAKNANDFSDDEIKEINNSFQKETQDLLNDIITKK